MAAWLLNTRFPSIMTPQTELAVEVRGIPESRLVPLMRRLDDGFPKHKVFSLPHLGEDAHILIGVRGREGTRLAFEALLSELSAEGIDYIRPPEPDG
jgi:molybdopterin-biosynthesis enzyme MoeA-like protein